jgi:hypothetical protein
MNLIIALAFSVTVMLKKHTGAAIFIRNGKSFAEEFHLSNSLELARGNGYWHKRCTSP